MSLVKTSYKEILLNPMTQIAGEWMLVTAGNKDRGYNTMTASWGHLGSLWGNGGGAPTVVVYIRPQRYTKKFIDREEYFTLSFFPQMYKREMTYIGSHSGRDEDKIAKVGLTPVFDLQSTWFEEAKLVFKCRKLYHAPLLAGGFVDPNIVRENYPEGDFHEMYIGKITETYCDVNR